jgi:tetratricopeptide (TPR) repeat protein
MDEVWRSLRWGEGESDLRTASSKEMPRARSTKKDRLARVQEDQYWANKLYAEGISYAKQKRIPEATSAWKRVLEYSILNELRGATLFNLGLASESSEEWEQAIEFYKKSLHANPNQTNALCNIGAIYMRQGWYNLAVHTLLEAVQRDPGDHVAMHNLIQCYEHLGDRDEASRWRGRRR